MKTESTVKFVLRLTVTLLLITSVVAALLAAVDGITAPKIAALNAQKTQQAIEAVLPGGGQETTFTDDTGLVAKVYKGENGYAVQVTPAGFGGEITMMVGVGNDGTVLGISVISQSETPSLGAVCAATTAKGEEFRAQFAGLTGTVAVTKDDGQVNAISSATITSRAVCNGVNAALACVEAMG